MKDDDLIDDFFDDEVSEYDLIVDATRVEDSRRLALSTIGLYISAFAPLSVLIISTMSVGFFSNLYIPVGVIVFLVSFAIGNNLSSQNMPELADEPRDRLRSFGVGDKEAYRLVGAANEYRRIVLVHNVLSLLSLVLFMVATATSFLRYSIGFEVSPSLILIVYMLTVSVATAGFAVIAINGYRITQSLFNAMRAAYVSAGIKTAVKADRPEAQSA